MDTTRKANSKYDQVLSYNHYFKKQGKMEYPVTDTQAHTWVQSTAFQYAILLQWQHWS